MKPQNPQNTLSNLTENFLTGGKTLTEEKTIIGEKTLTEEKKVLTGEKAVGGKQCQHCKGIFLEHIHEIELPITIPQKVSLATPQMSTQMSTQMSIPQMSTQMSTPQRSATSNGTSNAMPRNVRIYLCVRCVDVFQCDHYHPNKVVLVEAGGDGRNVYECVVFGCMDHVEIEDKKFHHYYNQYMRIFKYYNSFLPALQQKDPLRFKHFNDQKMEILDTFNKEWKIIREQHSDPKFAAPTIQGTTPNIVQTIRTSSTFFNILTSLNNTNSNSSSEKKPETK